MPRARKSATPDFMAKIQANNIQIEYEIHGQGEPLLLISGLGYSRWMWRRLIPALSKEFQVISFDNRGVGGTDRTPGPYTADLLAADTAALLDALHYKQVNVLGISMGGFIAQALTLKRPDLVQRLILAATHFGGRNHVPIPAETLAIMTDISGDARARVERGVSVACAPGTTERQPDLIQDFIEHRSQNPIEIEFYKAQGAIGMAMYADENSFESKLKNILIPSLILSGDSDRVVPVENTKLLAQVLKNSRVEILPEAGHFFPLEVPHETAKVISSFIRGQ